MTADMWDHPPSRPSPPRTGSTVWLTVNEVARRVYLSKMSVYRAIHAGELEAARFGRSFRVSEAAYRRWVAGAMVQ